jgi:hypothetical protein
MMSPQTSRRVAVVIAVVLAVAMILSMIGVALGGGGTL